MSEKLMKAGFAVAGTVIGIVGTVFFPKIFKKKAKKEESEKTDK